MQNKDHLHKHEPTRNYATLPSYRPILLLVPLLLRHPTRDHRFNQLLRNLLPLQHILIIRTPRHMQEQHRPLHALLRHAQRLPLALPRPKPRQTRIIAKPTKITPHIIKRPDRHPPPPTLPALLSPLPPNIPLPRNPNPIPHHPLHPLTTTSPPPLPHPRETQPRLQPLREARPRGVGLGARPAAAVDVVVARVAEAGRRALDGEEVAAGGEADVEDEVGRVGGQEVGEDSRGRVVGDAEGGGGSDDFDFGG